MAGNEYWSETVKSPRESQYIEVHTECLPQHRGTHRVFAATPRYTPSVCRNTEVHTECLPLLNHWAKRWSGSYNKPADAVRSY